MLVQRVSLRILTAPPLSAIDIDKLLARSMKPSHFTLEEHRVAGGLGAAVAEEL